MARALARGAWLLSALLACAQAGHAMAGVQAEVREIWEQGKHDVYLPLITHHLRFAYDRQSIERYQERPPGLGYGRSVEADGLWRSLYGMGFQDSHYKPSYMLGYARQWLARPAPGWRVGAGYTAFLMSRADIGHYTPFPGVLPTASVGFRGLSLEGAFVPGRRGTGNILFLWGRIELDGK